MLGNRDEQGHWHDVVRLPLICPADNLSTQFNSCMEKIMDTRMKISVVIVDDHALIREAVRNLLSDRTHISLVGEGSAGEDVLRLVAEQSPDVLLLDISMPQKANDPAGGKFAILPALEALQNDHAHTKVIILSQHLQPALIQAIMRFAVNGYLLKSDDLTLKLAEAVEVVSRGGIYFSREASRAITEMSTEIGTLTEKQRAVLLAVAQKPDVHYSELADEMVISLNTFKWHLRQAFQTLGVSNVTAALIVCMERGLIPFFKDSRGEFYFGAYGESQNSELAT
jgi:DNA-binding NarL/FixJ family response regulator